MKLKILLALTTVLLAANSLADPAAPDLVIDAIVSEGSTGADKYAIQKIRVVSVIQNHTSYAIPEEISVAHHSQQNDIPAGNARLFLRTYYKSSPDVWLLIRFQVTSKNNALRTPAWEYGAVDVMHVVADL